MARDFLTPEIISKIDSLHIRARRVVEGFIVGNHKSPYHGFSAEFSEHRAYGIGDEIKNYKPKKTQTMKIFERKGFITQNGLGMLVNQAAESFKLWFNINLTSQDIKKVKLLYKDNK